MSPRPSSSSPARTRSRSTCRASRTPSAPADQVGSTAQLFFYDWEANILDEECKTDPDHNANQRQPINGLRAAVTQASKCTDVGTGKGSDPLADDSPGGESAGGRRAALLRLRQDDQEAVRPTVRRSTRARTRWTRSTEAEQANAEVIEVPAGVLVLREQKADAGRLRSRTAGGSSRTVPACPARTSRTRSRASTRPSATSRSSRSTSPTRAARRSRRSRAASPSAASTTRSAGDPIQTSQHFAIALDNELVSAPYINWRENPDGIDGSTGAQISGSFTIQSAQDLAKILKIGALPLKLNEVSRSQVSATLGKQALDQGLKAGIAGFIIVALFLIIFYRVLGVIATVALCIYALYFYAIVKLIPITLTLPGIAGLDPDARRRRGREHRRLRTGERGGAGREIGRHRDHHGLPQGPDGDHRREHRHVPGRVHPLHHRDRGRPGLRLHARPRRHRLAVHGGAGDAGDPVLAARHAPDPLQGARSAPASSASSSGIDYMGKAKWFFSLSGLHPARLRAGDVRQGHQLRHRLRRRHAHHRVAGEAATVDQVRDTLAPLGLADAKIQTLQNPELGKNVVQISTKELGPDGVDAATSALERRSSATRISPNVESIGPSFGKTVAQSAIYRDHRVAARHLDLHRAALRVEVRGAGADRVDARHPDRGRRLRTRRAGR